MPALKATINGANGAFPDGSVPQWRLSVLFSRVVYGGGNDPVDEAGYFPPGEPAGAVQFQPTFTNPAFIGGDAYLAVEVCGLTKTLQFRILGTNPPFASITQRLGDDKYCALCWQESRYRQFEGPERLPNGGSIGMPLPCYANDGGYGLMQITNPAPSIEDLWNWHTNCGSGIRFFGDKARESDALVAWWNAHKNPIPSPPIAYTDEQSLLDIYCRYRGGHYWEPERKKDEHDQYVGHEYILVVNPSSGDGVAHANLVMGYKTSRPWLGPFN